MDSCQAASRRCNISYSSTAAAAPTFSDSIRPRNGRLSLYPLKFEDALRALAKAKPETKKANGKKRLKKLT